jgi:hypothetical protein
MLNGCILPGVGHRQAREILKKKIAIADYFTSQKTGFVNRCLPSYANNGGLTTQSTETSLALIGLAVFAWRAEENGNFLCLKNTALGTAFWADARMRGITFSQLGIQERIRLFNTVVLGSYHTSSNFCFYC